MEVWARVWESACHLYTKLLLLHICHVVLILILQHLSIGAAYSSYQGFLAQHLNIRAVYSSSAALVTSQDTSHVSRCHPGDVNIWLLLSFERGNERRWVQLWQ